MTGSAEPTHSRASLLTPLGRGAVAVIAAEGIAAIDSVDVHFHAANRRPLGSQPINAIAFGRWTDASPGAAAEGEEVIVCRTGAARVEVHCHGGVAAPERILGALAAAGCRTEPWADWLQTHIQCPLAAEAEVALAAAATRRTADILADQRQGALRRAIDLIDADLATATPAALAGARTNLAALLDRASLGRRLTRPWQVAIAGRPNVGKSSLLNALVGYERAIVFDQPGTTRDVLAAETAIDGWPVRLTDAAGLRRTTDAIEAAGVEIAREHLLRSDLVIWVLDASALSPDELSDPITTAQRQLTEEINGADELTLLPVVNKSDRAIAEAPPGVVRTCAITGAGLEILMATLSRRLVPHPPAPGEAVPFTARQIERLTTAQEQLATGRSAAARQVLSTLTAP